MLTSKEIDEQVLTRIDGMKEILKDASREELDKFTTILEEISLRVTYWRMNQIALTASGMLLSLSVIISIAGFVAKTHPYMILAVCILSFCGFFAKCAFETHIASNSIIRQLKIFDETIIQITTKEKE